MSPFERCGIRVDLEARAPDHGLRRIEVLPLEPALEALTHERDVPRAVPTQGGDKLHCVSTGTERLDAVVGRGHPAARGKRRPHPTA